MKNLNGWLRKTPQPVTVLADDKSITVPKNGRAWRDLTQTIEALDPTKLTCLNGQGEIIRSITLESDEKGGEPASPEMSDVQMFAKLISEAYEKGSKVNAPLIEQIMTFLERQSQTLAKANSDLEKVRDANLKLRAQVVELHAQLNATPEDTGEQSIIGAIAAAAMQGQADAAQNGAVTPIKQPRRDHSEGGKK